MQIITDGLLITAALFAGAYCWVLARRVEALKNLDSGLGGAITRLTCALEDARRALEEAKAATREGRQELRELITRADAASGQLRILLAASRDVAPAPAAAPAEPEVAPPDAPEPPAEAAPAADPAARAAAAIPKPRPVFPVEMLRPRPAAAAAVPADEPDILAELAALAAGQRR